jgi:hypothetical protein
MITTLVQFAIPQSLEPADVTSYFEQAAPDFRHPDGLIRKYFLVSDDGKHAGGVYLWRSRTHAAQFYGNGFQELVAGLFGTLPTISYFETPVVVDNLTGEIIQGPADLGNRLARTASC